MNCPNCNTPIAPNDVFCTNCGYRVDGLLGEVNPNKAPLKSCPQCQQSILESEHYCSNCGYSFDGQPHFVSSDLATEVVCPNCGNRVSNTVAHCPYCNFRLSYKPFPKVTAAGPPYKTYSPSNFNGSVSIDDYSALRGYQLAPLGSRIAAYCIDTIVMSVGEVVCACVCFYGLFKDGLNEGRSVGKNAMHLRVINYNTGAPATYGESCVRNFCSCCPCWLFVDKEHRRIGDYIAGTIVIKDE